MFGVESCWRVVLFAVFLVVLNVGHAHSLLRHGQPIHEKDDDLELEQQPKSLLGRSSGEEAEVTARNPAFKGIPDSVFEKYFENVLSKAFKKEYHARKEEKERRRPSQFRHEFDRQQNLESYRVPVHHKRPLQEDIDLKMQKRLAKSMESILLQQLASAVQSQSELDRTDDYPRPPRISSREDDFPDLYAFPRLHRPQPRVWRSRSSSAEYPEKPSDDYEINHKLQQEQGMKDPYFPPSMRRKFPSSFSRYIRRIKDMPMNRFSQPSFKNMFIPSRPFNQRQSSVSIYPNVAAFHIQTDRRKRHLPLAMDGPMPPPPPFEFNGFGDADQQSPFPQENILGKLFRSRPYSQKARAPAPAFVEFRSDSVQDMPEKFRQQSLMDVLRNRKMMKTRALPPMDEPFEQNSDFSGTLDVPETEIPYFRNPTAEPKLRSQQHFPQRNPLNRLNGLMTKVSKPQPPNIEMYQHWSSFPRQTEEVELPSQPIDLRSESSEELNHFSDVRKLASFKISEPESPNSSVETQTSESKEIRQEVNSTESSVEVTEKDGNDESSEESITSTRTEPPSSEKVAEITVPDPLKFAEETLRDYQSTGRKPMTVRVLPSKFGSTQDSEKHKEDRAESVETSDKSENTDSETSVPAVPQGRKPASMASKQNVVNTKRKTFNVVNPQDAYANLTLAEVWRHYWGSFPVPEEYQEGGKFSPEAMKRSKEEYQKMIARTLNHDLTTTSSRKVKRELRPQDMEAYNGASDNRDDGRVSTLGMLDGDSHRFEETPQNRRRSFPCSVNTAVGREACDVICRLENMAVKCTGPYCNCFQDSNNRAADTERNSAKCGPNTNFGRAGCRLVCDGVDDLITCSELNCYCNRHKNVNKGNPQMDGMGRLTTGVLGEYFYCGPANGVNQCSDICRGWGHVSCGELSCYCDRGGS